ncbi:hypothetical protein [Natronomonas sp. EA1]|uniref:hypothetical protein n=1 Tax=Natronomonas sp. EA1 TaxID=3421655 RepID=UPI003EB776DC
MVGPLTDEERNEGTFKLKAGFVLLVGVSAGLITLQGDPAIEIVAGAIVGGLLLGVLLVWYIFPGTGETKRTRR